MRGRKDTLPDGQRAIYSPLIEEFDLRNPTKSLSKPEKNYLQEWHKHQILEDDYSLNSQPSQPTITILRLEQQEVIRALRKEQNKASIEVTTQQVGSYEQDLYKDSDEEDRNDEEAEKEQQQTKEVEQNQQSKQIKTKVVNPILLGYHEACQRQRHAGAFNQDTVLYRLKRRFEEKLLQKTFYDLPTVDIPPKDLVQKWLKDHLHYYANILRYRGRDGYDNDHHHDKFFFKP